MSIPSSTYRLQMHKDFPFSEAGKRIGYLKDLGIGAVYLSPILLAKPGSTHGYDICDHNRINPELGGEEGFLAYAAALKEAGIGCLLDFVPNHMGADSGSNPWWWDILENGQSSPYRGYFDIDWDPLKPDLKGKVLLPILGDQYGKTLERGEIRLEFAEGGFRFRYGDNIFPVNPGMIPAALGDQSGLPMGDAEPEAIEYLSIMTAYRNLPVNPGADGKLVQERHREKEVARKRLAALVEAYPVVRTFIEAKVAEVNGIAGQVKSYDRLHALLEGQFYRLAYWRTAGQEINYRRFFDVNGLAGLRMENPEVMDATHSLVLRLAAEGSILGLRIDHVDGLYNPAGYLARLRSMAEAAVGGAVGAAGAAVGAAEASGKAFSQGSPSPFYIIVEKILCGEELLSRDWPVQGTTGYEFLSDLNGLFVDPAGLAKLGRLFRSVTGRSQSFIQEARHGKRLILETSMSSELNVLANGIDRLSEADRNFRDFTLEALRNALRETVVCLPIYRTYEDSGEISERDREAIEAALQAAALENPAMEGSIFGFLRTVLLPSGGNGPSPETRTPETTLSAEQRLDFSMKLQQLSGAVQAKGVEDTAFYRHLVLLSLNEVGGDPGSSGIPADEFHRRIRIRMQTFPHTLLATATHDTKRGEDARARINVLSQVPDAWRRAVSRLAKLAAAIRRGPGEAAPSDIDAYLLFQSMIGCWPMGPDGKPLPADAALADRLRAFAVKAAREAKLRTSWINPNGKYESALAGLVDELLLGASGPKVAKALFPVLETCAREGAFHSLNQIACKCAAPGVPDVYQGTETWDLSLVDPDNRRAVDFEELASGLTWIRNAFAPSPAFGDRAVPGESDPGAEARRGRILDLLDRWPDGRIKQFVLWQCLQWRKAFPDLFLAGAYHPVAIRGDGPAALSWLAFYRQHGGRNLLVCIRIRSPSVTLTLPDPVPPLSLAYREVSGNADGLATGNAEVNGGRAERTGGEELVLPGEWSGKWLVHAFTGTRFRAAENGEDCRVPLAAIAADFPTAWLWME